MVDMRLLLSLLAHKHQTRALSSYVHLPHMASNDASEDIMIAPSDQAAGCQRGLGDDFNPPPQVKIFCGRSALRRRQGQVMAMAWC
jgi:hypothetical protein